MKKLLLVLTLALTCRTASAAAVSYIQSKSTGTQLGATIFVDTGTIRNLTASTMTVTRAFRDSALSAGTSGYTLNSRGATLGPQWLPSASVSIGGSSGQIQYNNAGSFAGLPSFVTASSVTISTPTAIMGSITNDAAATGFVGEYIESIHTGNSNVPTSGQWGDMTSIILSSGDWIVTACATVNNNGATSGGFLDFGIGTAPGNSATGLIFGENYLEIPMNTTAGVNASPVIPSWRVSIASSTPYYWKLSMTYSIATPQVAGYRISAWRVR